MGEAGCLLGGWGRDYLGNYHNIYNNTATIAFDVKASDIRIIEFSFEEGRVGKCRGGVEKF